MPMLDALKHRPGMIIPDHELIAREELCREHLHDNTDPCDAITVGEKVGFYSRCYYCVPGSGPVRSPSPPTAGSSGGTICTPTTGATSHLIVDCAKVGIDWHEMRPTSANI